MGSEVVWAGTREDANVEHRDVNRDLRWLDARGVRLEVVVGGRRCGARYVASVLVGFVVACGPGPGEEGPASSAGASATETEPGGGAEDEGLGDEGGGGASTETGDDAEGDGGEDGGDSQDEGGAGDTDGEGEVDLRLQPLDVGRTWTYVRVSGEPGSACEGDEPFTFAVVAEELFDGRMTQRVRNPIGGCEIPDSVYSVRGINLVDQYWQSWEPTWQPRTVPPMEGRTWEMPRGGDRMTMTWRYHGDYSGPAGAFEGCWRRETVWDYANSTDADWIACPGVGAVEWGSMTQQGVVYRLIDFEVPK